MKKMFVLSLLSSVLSIVGGMTWFCFALPIAYFFGRSDETVAWATALWVFSWNCASVLVYLKLKGVNLSQGVERWERLIGIRRA